MKHNMPYELKPIEHTSASGIKDMMSCDAKHGYTRNCVGVPTLPQPVAAVYGVVFHFFAEWLGHKFWKVARSQGRLPEGYGKQYLKTARGFLYRVLKQQSGPRGFNDDRIEPIRWFSPRKQLLLSAAEYREAVDEQIGQMLGSIYNALEAYRLHFTLPNRCTNMVFELGFSGSNIRVKAPFEEVSIKLDGFIDWIKFYGSGRYIVCDFKTGWVISEYTKRVNVVEDIQMTLYDFAGRKLFNRPPEQMFIQPMVFASSFLDEHGPEAMNKKRILIPSRTQAHVVDLELLATDVFQVSNMIAQIHKYSQSELDEWEPQSTFGRKAQFEQSLRQRRYVPRIGPGCDFCKYIGLCQKDNAADWHEYARTTGSEDAEPVVDPYLSEPRDKPEFDNRLIFDLAPRRSPYISKSKREIKILMLETGNFVPVKTLKKTKNHPTVTGMVPFFNKVLEWMRALGDCPCTRHKLFPIHIAPYLRDLYFGKVSLSQILAECPMQDCPHRRKEDQKIS